MKTLRVVEMDVDAFEIGDRIQVGKYTATCQKVTKKAYLFCFDQYLDQAYSMNLTDTNKGGYEASNLRKELQKDEVLDIFSPVREYMIPFKNGDYIRIPYAEELFGSIGGVEPSNKGQWELMKDRINRTAYRNDCFEWGWFQNTVTDSADDFACVTITGIATCNSASLTLGVRPVFGLRKEIYDD